MDKKLTEELKAKLEKTKADVEKALRKFAEENENLKGDWSARFPRFEENGSSSSAMEGAADEVEEYGTLLSLEHNLETRLKDINSALEKIKKGKYGKCEKCGEEIQEARLKVSPEAKKCLKC